jgi:hypothetical protein
MPKTMPGLCLAGAFEGSEHGFRLRIKVALGSGKIAVAGQVGKRVRSMYAAQRVRRVWRNV